MINQAIAPGAVNLEYQHGLLDAQAMEMEYGKPVVIHVRGEAGVVRDGYGDIIGRPTDKVTMTQNAATIDYQPTKYQLEKAGLQQSCDVLVWVAAQDFIDNGLAFDDLETKRMTIDIQAIFGEVNGNAYEVKEKARAGSFANGYLYVTFGLTRLG